MALKYNIHHISEYFRWAKISPRLATTFVLHKYLVNIHVLSCQCRHILNVVINMGLSMDFSMLQIEKQEGLVSKITLVTLPLATQNDLTAHGATTM